MVPESSTVPGTKFVFSKYLMNEWMNVENLEKNNENLAHINHVLECRLCNIRWSWFREEEKSLKEKYCLLKVLEKYKEEKWIDD